MLRRLGFVIVYLLLLFPSYLLMVVVMIVGHIGAILIWIATGKDIDDMSDKVVDVVYWFINIPYKLFGYD